MDKSLSGDEVVYLDPHHTQEAGTIAKKHTEEEVELDKSYHCSFAQRIPFYQLDPSLALVSGSCCVVGTVGPK